MERQLGQDVIHDVLEKFSDSLFAFAPVHIPNTSFFGLGIAEANIKGYSPISGIHYTIETYDEAADEADRLNLEALDMSPDEGARIIFSTMGGSS